MRRHLVLLLSLVLLVTIAVAHADEFDPELQAKADFYSDWAPLWHSGQLGAHHAATRFVDTNYDEIECAHTQGDSMIWTGMYLAAQAIRYRVTGEQDAYDEVVRVVNYMHDAMDITDTLGYLPRYADIDEMPYNCNLPPGHGWRVKGTGEWEGYFWVDHTSRDQYSGYWFGMAEAYDAIEDEDVRDIIRQDLADIIQMLEENWWNITDQNGQWTGNGAAWVGPIMRLGWLVRAAHVLDDPYYWDLLERQYHINKPFLEIDTNSFLNKYSEYYGNNLRHLAYMGIFRLWPKRDQLEHFWEVWMKHNRPWTKNCNNPWFDAVHVVGCRRLGVCDEDELEAIAEDTHHTLDLYWDGPNSKQAITCSEMELDPFSVFMDELLDQFPWLRELINIQPQTKYARELNDRHWTDMYWQSHGVFEATCSHGADPTYVGSGFDYLLAYYMNVFYGLLPGEGPYGDDDPVDDDTVDDDTADDDTVDDDTIDDDDDDDEDQADDDDNDNDDTTGDDDDDQAPSEDDDDDNDDGCGC